MSKIIIIFGNGYVSKFLTQKLAKLGWIIYCLSRRVDVEKIIGCENVKLINFFNSGLPSIIKSSKIILSTLPPENKIIDPVLQIYSDLIAKENFQWIGYLSSTNVYGDQHGTWVDEETKCVPNNEKARIRLLAEEQWLNLYLKYKLPIHILRLSGIYGPSRNCLEEIKNGKDFTILKKNQLFSRIHVTDICNAIIASINSPTAGEIYNVSDDEPAPFNVVQQFGAAILNKNHLK